MKTRMVIALLAACFGGGQSFAAELPVAGSPQPFYPGRLLPVEWTGLYFGVNAGYGWAKGSSTTVFTGALVGGTTTPGGLGATELSGTDVLGSSSPRGGIAGGQIGFNWQAGMVVFGAEVDAQWSGQQITASSVCTPTCTATEAVKIKSLTTGRARVGLAFDWLLPYVTAGGALVNTQDNLALTAGGVTGNFQALSNTTLGWTAGAGVDVALSSNWSARFEYLHIRANDLNSTAPIPGILGAGTALQSASYRDNILRIGVNYRFGPRGGPGVLEAPIAPNAYAVNYDFLPSVRQVADNTKPAKPQQATPSPVVTADAAPETSSIALQPNPTQPVVKSFDEIGALEDRDIGARADRNTIVLPTLSAKKPREKEEDESQRLKRLMAICAGC